MNGFGSAAYVYIGAFRLLLYAFKEQAPMHGKMFPRTNTQQKRMMPELRRSMPSDGTHPTVESLTSGANDGFAGPTNGIVSKISGNKYIPIAEYYGVTQIAVCEKHHRGIGNSRYRLMRNLYWQFPKLPSWYLIAIESLRPWSYLPSSFIKHKPVNPVNGHKCNGMQQPREEEDIAQPLTYTISS